MPNWCENQLTVYGPTDDVQAFYDAIHDGETENRYGKMETVLDITGKLKPMPKVLEGTRSPVPTGEFDEEGQFTKLVEDDSNTFWTPELYEERKKEHYDLIEKAEKAKAETGFYNWYDWANYHYGTKWGSCEVQWTGGDNVDGDNSTRFFTYDTAWGPLMDTFWVPVSEMFPTLTFTIYYEEHGMCFHGVDAYKDGDVIGSESDDLPQPPEDATQEESERFYDGENYYELIEIQKEKWLDSFSDVEAHF